MVTVSDFFTISSFQNGLLGEIDRKVSKLLIKIESSECCAEPCAEVQVFPDPSPLALSLLFCGEAHAAGVHLTQREE